MHVPARPFRFVLVLSLLALSASALADHDRGRGKSRDRNWRRDYARTDVESTIRRAEESADRFRERMNDQLDDSSLDGTRREDDINHQVGELENALDGLRKRFDRSDSWRETRADVEQVLLEARDVDRIMTGDHFRGSLDGDWQQLRGDLDALARAYDLPSISRSRSGYNRRY